MKCLSIFGCLSVLRVKRSMMIVSEQVSEWTISSPRTSTQTPDHHTKDIGIFYFFFLLLFVLPTFINDKQCEGMKHIDPQIFLSTHAIKGQ